MAKPIGKDSPAIMREEIKYMRKGGAPKSLIEHERAEHAHSKEEGMEAYANGGKVKRCADGGGISAAPNAKKMANGGGVSVQPSAKKMADGGGVRSATAYANGGGIASPTDYRK